MRAKIRAHNVPPARLDEWERAKRAYILEAAEEYSQRLQWKMTRRVICAVCLALSDQYGFGTRRCRKIIDGFTDILRGIGEEVYDPREIEPDGVDRAVDEMLAELADRGIEIGFAGDENYETPDRVCERLGIQNKAKGETK